MSDKKDPKEELSVKAAKFAGKIAGKIASKAIDIELEKIRNEKEKKKKK